MNKTQERLCNYFCSGITFEENAQLIYGVNHSFGSFYFKEVRHHKHGWPSYNDILILANTVFSALSESKCRWFIITTTPYRVSEYSTRWVVKKNLQFEAVYGEYTGCTHSKDFVYGADTITIVQYNPEYANRDLRRTIGKHGRDIVGITQEQYQSSIYALARYRAKERIGILTEEIDNINRLLED